MQEILKEFDALSASMRVAQKNYTLEQVTALKTRCDSLTAALLVAIAELTPAPSPFEREVNKFLAEVTAAGGNKDLKSVAVDKFVTALETL